MNLASAFELSARELVAFVGAGGKSSLMIALGQELAERSRAVIITTTTRLGADEIGASVSTEAAPASVRRALAQPGPLFLIGATDGTKVAGFAPDEVDLVWSDSGADYVLVEADGARRKSIKAPALHEPVIPSLTSLVVVVVGVDAVGCKLSDVAHRPELVAALTGLESSDLLTTTAAARLLAHPEGGLKSVPDNARVVVAITKVSPGTRQQAAAAIQALLSSSQRISRVVEISDFTVGHS